MHPNLKVDRTSFNILLLLSFTVTLAIIKLFVFTEKINIKL